MHAGGQPSKLWMDVDGMEWNELVDVTNDVETSVQRSTFSANDSLKLRVKQSNDTVR